MAAKFRVKDGVQIGELGSCLPEQPVLVHSRGKYLQLKGDAKALIVLLKQGSYSAGELEAALRQKHVETLWDSARILNALERLRAYSLVEPLGQDLALKENTSRPRREIKWMLTLPVFSPRHLSWLTRPLSRLLVPSWVLAGVPALLLLQVMAWIRILHPVIGSATALTATVHALTPKLFWLLALGNYLGLFIHELGHAAACVRCGVMPGPIGLCLYWILPGFYTDVNQAWRLPASKRLLVDAGGIFFSLLCATIALLGFILTGWTVSALLAGIYDITVAINLVPFLRMDGYWMVSDGLGIPNLMRVNKELSQWLILRILGIDAVEPSIFKIDKWRRYSYSLYYLGFVLFTVAFLWKIAVWYVPQLVHLIVTVTASLVGSVESRQTADVLKNILKLIVVILPAIGLSIYFGRAAKGTIAWVAGVLSQSHKPEKPNVQRAEI
jgi:hypothetical protein